MPGGIHIDDSGGNHFSQAKLDYAAEDADYKAAALRADSDMQLADPSVVELVDEYGDGVSVQILTVFPGMILQQIRNTIAVRVIRPRGVDKTELDWIHLGFDGDDEAMTERRLRQGNLVGAAGYISMEDGCVGGFVQRALQYNDDDSGVVMMGGHEAAIADLPRQRSGDPRLLEEIPRAHRHLTSRRDWQCASFETRPPAAPQDEGLAHAVRKKPHGEERPPGRISNRAIRRCRPSVRPRRWTKPRCGSASASYRRLCRLHRR